MRHTRQHFLSVSYRKVQKSTWFWEVLTLIPVVPLLLYVGIDNCYALYDLSKLSNHMDHIYIHQRILFFFCAALEILILFLLRRRRSSIRLSSKRL